MQTSHDALDVWMAQAAHGNLIAEVFEDGRLLCDENELRYRFGDATRAVLADQATFDLVERVLFQLSARKLPLPIVHFTLRGVRLPDGSIAPTGFDKSIFQLGFDQQSNFGAFVHRTEDGWKLANPEDLDEEAAVTQALLLVFRYLKHGMRTNKDRLGELRDAGEGVPVAVIANPRDAHLIRGMDGVDHYVCVSRVNRIIGVMAADRLSPDEVVRDFFLALDRWLEFSAA